MPIDVDQAKEKASRVAGEAAQAANTVAAKADPTLRKMSAELDDLAKAATPYAQKAEKSAKNLVDKVLGRKPSTSGGGHSF